MGKEITTTGEKSLEIMGIKITSFQEAIKIAEYFSGTDLVPKDYRNKPANIVVAWQKGMELGLKPLQALSTIAVVNGRATVWGDGLIALVKNTSKEEWTNEWIEGDGDNMVAWCETKRQSQEQTIKRSFSVLEAIQAGLWGNNTWAKYPKRMLQMRARGLCLRDAYPDTLTGIEIAEEINDLRFNQATEIKEAPKTLEQLGLQSIEKDGFLVVEGNTYGKTDTLKTLGFEYRNSNWCKELPKGEEIIDITTDKEEVKTKQTSAKLLMDLLILKGIAKEKVGEFVKNVLGLSSKDEDEIKKILSKPKDLDALVKDFLEKPSISVEDVF
jgi:hypothetical protein